MRKSGFVLAQSLLIVGLLLVSVAAQKSYKINSITSNVYVNSGSCDVSVVETYVYAFWGSYSSVARAIPYSIASSSGFQSSSLKVDVLTPGYTVSKYTTDQQDAKFIMVNMNPSTPSGLETIMTIRYSYSLTGPIRQSGSSNLVTYYYREGAEISNLNATFNFDSSIDLKGGLFPSFGGVVVGNSVNFQKTSLISNTAFQPSVSFNTVSGQFDKCSPGLGVGTIIAIVIVLTFCVCLSIVCSIIGYFRRAVSNTLGLQRWGWGGSSSYGYVSNDPYYTHQHYHSGHHHHHHSSSGGGSRGGITGTSGFAN